MRHMRISTRVFTQGTEQGLVILAIPSKGKQMLETPAFQKMNGLTGGELARIAKEDAFTGKAKRRIAWRGAQKEMSLQVVCLGIGSLEACEAETVREFAGLCIKEAEAAKQSEVAIYWPAESPCSMADVAALCAEAIELAAYTYTTYKAHKRALPKTCVLVSPPAEEKAMKQGIKQGQMNAMAVNLCRDLVNTPGGHMHPGELVQAARRVAGTSPLISIKVHGKAELKKLGAGGILGVSQGSSHAPALVHMVYKPKNRAKRRVALVGKAVTFDTGGLSLKPADGMMNMKIDMAGAAAVIGVFARLAKKGVNVEVHGIFGACENSVSAEAIRPGDVITVMNGKTVEVLNTDAEGRLTLADALEYATRQKPDTIVDLATLTGACLVALGEEISGVMANEAGVAKDLLEAGAKVGEKVWELPLEKRYAAQMISDVADYRNIGGRYGGTLTAGLFLQPFVKKIPWAHIDIAGPCYAEKPLASYLGKGATGHGVRLLLSYLEKM